MSYFLRGLKRASINSIVNVISLQLACCLYRTTVNRHASPTRDRPTATSGWLGPQLSAYQSWWFGTSQERPTPLRFATPWSGGDTGAHR